MQIKSDEYIRNSYWISGSSLPEQLLYRSLLQIFPRAINRAIERVINTEFDIVVPELRLRIEYSGEFWHKEKTDKDQLRREFCRQNKINYVEIIDTPEVVGIELEKNDLHTIYRLHNNGDYRYITNNIRVIIENMCGNFGISEYINIDYNQALYEAILFSSKYNFRLLRNNEHEIMGREFIKVKEVNYVAKQEYQTLRLDKIPREQLGFTFFNDIEAKDILLTIKEHNDLSDLAYSGDTFEKYGLNPKVSIAEKERKLMQKEMHIEREQLRLKRLSETLEKRKMELEKLTEQLERKRNIIRDRYNKLYAAESRCKDKIHKLGELYQRMTDREHEAENEIIKYNEMQKEIMKEHVNNLE